MKNIITLFSFICLLFVSQSAYAVKTATVVTGETVEATTTLSKKDAKKQARLEKRIAKIEKKSAAQDIDFRDNTEKWMWFWISGWVLAALLRLIGGLGLTILAGALGLFGTISLIIWLVKVFS